MPTIIAPMPTKNPWAWALMGVGAQCWSMLPTPNNNEWEDPTATLSIIFSVIWYFNVAMATFWMTLSYG